MDTEPTSPPEILLVEDDRDVRETIAEILEQEGFSVTGARTGADAIQRLKDGPRLPMAVLLDLMMPVMDGWAFSTMQQSDTRWAAIPVVVISADSNLEDKANAIRAIAYLRKPFDIDELLAVLNRLVDGPGPIIPSVPESRSMD